MDNRREYNYDLLRIISTFAVVMIHISGTWVSGAVKDISENGLLIQNIQSPFFISLYNSISRFSVPSFLLLSGAFILDDPRNCEYKSFYSRSFAKIGIPVLVFSVLYILYRIPLCFVGEDNGVITLLLDIVKGSPMYHMWYMYMLIGVYLMAPIILRFKDTVSEEAFYKISFVFLVLASISRWTTAVVRLSWDVGQSFEYLGYFTVGYSIRKMNMGKKNNLKAILLIVAGIVFEICAAGLVYRQIAHGIAEPEYSILAPFSPLIVPATLLIFYGFTLLDFEKDMKKLSDITLYIFLIHAGVWHVSSNILYVLKGKDFLMGLDGTVWIPIFTALVSVISCFLSEAYIWLWKKIDKNKRVTERLCHMVHL